MVLYGNSLNYVSGHFKELLCYDDAKGWVDQQAFVPGPKPLTTTTIPFKIFYNALALTN